MQLGIDSNVLLQAHLPALDRHELAHRYLTRQLALPGVTLVLTPLVLHEFVHVVTDGRRFRSAGGHDRGAHPCARLPRGQEPWYYFLVTGRHRRTLAAIFERPPRKDLRFAAVESLLLALGGKKKERAGSRVAFVLRGGVLLLHRPHKPKVMRPGAVEDLRDFLASKGITPNDPE